MEGNTQKASTAVDATITNNSSSIKTKSKDYTFAAILIIIGIIFLLNNLGVLPWDFWISILQFWPLFLILIGLKMVIGTSKIAKILMTIFVVLVFAVLILFAVVTNNKTIFNGLGNKIPALSQIFNTDSSAREETISIDIPTDQTTEKRNFNFAFGAGDFIVTDDKSLEKSMVLNAKYVDGLGYPVVANEQKGTTQNIAFETESNFMRGFKTLYIINEMKYDFLIGQTDIPTNFEIDLGAGKAQIDFADQSIDEFDYTQGAGTGEISFTKSSLPTKLDVEVGAGTLKIFLPKDTQYKLEYAIGAGTVKFDGERLTIGNGTRQSDKYNKDDSITINLDLGAGTVDIEFIESPDTSDNTDSTSETNPETVLPETDESEILDKSKNTDTAKTDTVE